MHQQKLCETLMKWWKPGLALLLPLLWCGVVVAQEQPPAHPTQQPTSAAQLAPVVVTATRSETPLTQVPAAVSAVDQSDIQLGQPTIGLDES